MKDREKKSAAHKKRIAPKDIAVVGMMIAVIEVCKYALAGIPNVELTSFFIILFTLYLGNRIFYAIPAFILIEGVVYGFHLWWISYLYVWPLLAAVTLFVRKKNNIWVCAFLSCMFGLLFGFLCSFPYVFVGMAEGGIVNGFRAAFTWWIAGIPWDLVHGISNLVIMLVLYYPITKALQVAAGYVKKDNSKRAPK